MKWWFWYGKFVDNRSKWQTSNNREAIYGISNCLFLPSVTYIVPMILILHLFKYITGFADVGVWVCDVVNCCGFRVLQLIHLF